MNQFDGRKVFDQPVVVVSTQQQPLQQRQEAELMKTTRPTPFSIDNILGRPRDHQPCDQAPADPQTMSRSCSNGLSAESTTSDHQITTKVLTSRQFQPAPVQSSDGGEVVTSSNLDELQSLLNAKLRQQQQHHQETPVPPPSAPAPPPPHHHHHHYHHPHSHQSAGHLSQQQSTPVMPAPAPSFYTQFHRHLGILPSSIDGGHIFTPMF